MSLTTTVPAPLATPDDLAPADVAVVAAVLNPVLADAFALYLKTKNFHWHVSGPHFRDYHLMLDEQATEVFGITDAIAERVRKIGATTIRSIGDIARRQTIIDNDSAYVPPRAMLAELRDDNLALIDLLRQAKALADDARDNGTSAMIDGWTDEAERRAWFLFEAAQP